MLNFMIKLVLIYIITTLITGCGFVTVNVAIGSPIDKKEGSAIDMSDGTVSEKPLFHIGDSSDCSDVKSPEYPCKE